MAIAELPTWPTPDPTATTPAPAPATTTPTDGIIAKASDTLGTALSQGATGAGAPAQWNLDDNQTTAGQLDKITRQDSPLIQGAMTHAKEQMNERGLLNSSMAVTAGQQAVYNAALPVAQADAAAAQKSAAYNADQENQTTLFNAQQNNAWHTAQMDSASRMLLQNLQNQNQQLLNTNTQAASIFQNAVSALNNIATSTSMDANTKTEQSRQVYANLQQQLKVVSAISNLNLADILGGNPYQ